MEIQQYQNEIANFKREQKIHDAQNKLFELFINTAKSSSKEQVLKTTMQLALDLAADMADAQMGSIFLLNTHGVVTDSILTRNQLKGDKRSSLIGKVLDKGLAGWVKNNLKIGLVTDAEKDDRWVTFKDQSYSAASALAVPILRHDNLFGIITLLHSDKDKFDNACVDIVQKAANQMAIAIENAQLYKKLEQAGQAIEKYSQALQFELDQGRKIQQDFLPSDLPESDRCDIYAYFTPALKLSGDFYDVFELPGNHIGFAIGDVSGKGVGSALFMALTRSLLRVFSGAVSPDQFTQTDTFKPEQALKAVHMVNQYLAREHCGDGMFVTLIFCIIQVDSGKVWYINAGHEPVLVIGSEGIIEQLKATGPAVGPIEDAKYEIKSINLKKGQLIFGYTDGVSEARAENRDFYTRDRLFNAIDKTQSVHTRSSAQIFIRAIHKDLFQFIGDAPQSDDITMLAVRWNPPDSS